MASRSQKIEELIEGFHRVRHRIMQEGCFSGEAGRITASQWRVLMLVGERESLSLKEIAITLGITSSAATQLIDGLVKSGYAVRKTDEADRRISRIVLSPKTETLFKDLKKKHRAHITSFFDVLGDEELDQFAALYKKMVASLKNN